MFAPFSAYSHVFLFLFPFATDLITWADGAAAEKHRLEEKQRETRKVLKKRKEKEPEPL